MISTLNFSTETTGSGTYEDFVYLQSDQVDRTFEATNQTNIYKDLEGSGDFRFDVLGSSQEDQTTDPRGEPGSGTALAPRDLDGFKIKFSYGNESSVIEFSRDQAFEMDDESGTNRSTAGDYDAETNGDTVVVTIYGNDRANDIYTLNFSTETTGSGTYEDFVYLQSDQVDRTFEATNQTNIYKDLEGSGDFRSMFWDHCRKIKRQTQEENQVVEPRLPESFGGTKIKFSYDGGSSIIEFSDTYAYEMDDESGANREFAGDYDLDTDGDTLVVTFFGQDGANDIYTLNFSTSATRGSGELVDYEFLQADQVDDTFESTNQPNIYKDLEGSGYFRFDVLGSSPEDQTTDPRGEPEDHADAKAEFQPIPVSEVESFVNEVILQQDRLSGAKVMPEKAASILFRKSVLFMKLQLTEESVFSSIKIKSICILH